VFFIVFEANLLFCAYLYFSFENLFLATKLETICAKFVPKIQPHCEMLFLLLNTQGEANRCFNFLQLLSTKDSKSALEAVLGNSGDGI